jgi:hypothetical protein
MIVGISIPAWSQPREQLPPGFVIRLRVQLVRLLDENVPFLTFMFDKGRLLGSKAGRIDR